jgi:hypothetical protein
VAVCAVIDPGSGGGRTIRGKPLYLSRTP